jgi:cytoskeleton protein RodZ
MAERPSVNSTSIIGLSIMAVFIITAAVCWYFSWNPATYLSQKLRGVPENPVASSEQQMAEDQPTNKPATEAAESTTMLTETAVLPENEKAATKSTAVEDPTPEKSPITPPIIPIASLATTTAGQQKAVSPATPPSAQVNQPDKTTQSPIAPGTSTYLLKATAKEPIQLTIKVDNNPAERLSLAAGEQRNWNAGKSIVITLPAGSGATFTLNDIPLNLPKKASGQEITVSIPEYLLE